MVTEETIKNLDLSKLSNEELNELLSEAVGYAEDLILFEFDARFEEE